MFHVLGMFQKIWLDCGYMLCGEGFSPFSHYFVHLYIFKVLELNGAVCVGGQIIATVMGLTAL